MIFSKEVQILNVVSGNPVTLSETIIDFKFEQILNSDFFTMEQVLIYVT